MTGRIPWTRYSGEDVESVLATFISLEERDAIKIRPSRGDGGIDLIVYLDAETVEIYQIKKFAENLKNSQKAQIENSWQELSATTADLHVKTNSWHLVMPLDPTNENLRWASHWFNLGGNEVQNLECPSLALWIKPLTVRLGDKEAFCGFAKTTLVVGSFKCSTVETTDSEWKLVLSPDDQYGNKAVRVMVPPNEDVLKGRDALWTIRPPKVEDWLTMVEAAESSAGGLKQLPK